MVRGVPLGSGGSLCPVAVIALAVAPSFPAGPLVAPAIAVRAASLPGSGGSECWPRFGTVPAVPATAVLAAAETLPVPADPPLAVRAVGSGGFATVIPAPVPRQPLRAAVCCGAVTLAGAQETGAAAAMRVVDWVSMVRLTD